MARLGTFELTGIAGTFSTGLYPGSLAPLNANEVLFNGVDKGGLVGLWDLTERRPERMS